MDNVPNIRTAPVCAECAALVSLLRSELDSVEVCLEDEEASHAETLDMLRRCRTSRDDLREQVAKLREFVEATVCTCTSHPCRRCSLISATTPQEAT